MDAKIDRRKDDKNIKLYLKGGNEMELGNKILALRKKNNITQEELAEKLNVTRQTISKWELGETAPDIKQAKELSKFFKVSIDELVDNDIKDLLVERVSNTEKLAGMIIKIMKVGGFILFALLIIDLIFFLVFTAWNIVDKNNLVEHDTVGYRFTSEKVIYI